MQKLKFWSFSAFLMFALVLTSNYAWANKTNHPFDERVTLNGQALVKSGAALRSVLFIHAYSMALYLPIKANSYQQIIDLPENSAMRVIIVPHKLLDADAWVQSIERGFSKNLTDQEMSQMKPFLEQLYKQLRDLKTIDKGDVCTLDFIPGQGLVVGKNNNYLTPIGNRIFYKNILGIWLADIPADESLKRTLLGE